MFVQKHKIQIDTAQDRLNLVLHAGVNAALLGASVVGTGYANYVQGSPSSRMLFAEIPTIIGVVWAAAILGKSIRDSQSEDIRKFLGPRLVTPKAIVQKADVNHSLQQAAHEIAGRIGLKESPPIYILSGDVYDKSAYACAHPKKGIFVSEAIVQNFTPDEQKAVLSHEMAHIKARYTCRRQVLGTISSLACRIVLGDAFLNGAAAAINGAHMLFGQGGGSLAELGIKVAVMGGALVVTGGAATASAFMGARYARISEYQADRIGAQATSPSMMSGALVKLRNHQLKQYGIAALVAHESTSAFSEHPPISERIARLRAPPQP